MSFVEIESLVKRFGEEVAVAGIDLNIEKGEFVTLLGPSGCGKTTTLRCIAGLERPDTGEIRIEGEVLASAEKSIYLTPEDRNLGMVFQSYAVWPHMTVFDNVSFGLKIRRVGAKETKEKTNKALDLVGLAHLTDRFATKLSGGQRQRVALARAIVYGPRVVLFDEPLSNLDAKLRGQMRTEILRLQRRLGVTTVYVTHDQTEAMTLGDRVAVLKKGLLQQVASPRELYDQPVNLFVAGFIGSPPMNFVPARVRGNEIELPFATVPLRDEWRDRVEENKVYIAGIRPGAFEDAEFVDDDKRSRGVTFDVTIDVTEWLGNEQYAFVPFEADTEISGQLAELASELDSEQLRSQICVELDPMSRVSSGDKATLWLDASRLHLFDPQSGDNLTRSTENRGRHAAANA